MAVKRKKVFIIYDPIKYTSKDILKSLHEEGFKHHYKLSSDVDVEHRLTDYLLDSDEVWTFGDVERTYEVRLARELGCDLWIMG